MVRISDTQYRVAVLRTLAYLFTHPEIECGIRWVEDANAPAGIREFTVRVNPGAFWQTYAELERRHGRPKG